MQEVNASAAAKEASMKATEEEASVDNASANARLRVIWEYVWTLALMAFIVFGLRSSLADWYEVPSGSMLPTIQLGDRIFVNKLAYDLRLPFTGGYVPFTNTYVPRVVLANLSQPKRGDIVVFVYPEDNRTDYVKRLVGVPGDTIEVRENIVYINGQAMNRREVSQSELSPGAARETEAQLFKEKTGDVEHFVFEHHPDDFGPITVPRDRFFMMGDNRDNSSDSRSWGFVPRENLRGRALRVVLSFEPNTEPFPHAWQAILNFFNPSRVRWSRVLMPLNPPS